VAAASRTRTRTRRDAPATRAVAALETELVAGSPALRLNEFAVEQEVGRRSRELGAEGLKRKQRFQRDSVAFGKRMTAETAALHAGWAPIYDYGQIIPPARDLLHVYGPDVNKTGSNVYYQLAWTHIDDTQGAGIGATANINTGVFGGSHYTIGPGRNAYAGLGVMITPQLKWCKLGVRPFVQWSGYDTLYHVVYDDSVDETRWATAIGMLGIIVQSWDHSGGAYYRDARMFYNVWDRSEPNPSGSRDYDGYGNVTTGLSAEVLATSDREYAVWVCGRVWVAADPGFAVATRAGATISCHAPFMVVQEEPF